MSNSNKPDKPIFFKGQDNSTASNKLEELFNSLPVVPEEPEGRWKLVAIIAMACCAGLLGWGAFKPAGVTTSIEHSNGFSATIISSAGNVTFSNNPDLRRWHEVAVEERKAIKAEAIATFPQIKDIGEGVNWKPIAEWLVHEKQVIHANPRDLFRNLK